MGTGCKNLSRRFNPVDPEHFNIHENHIRLQSLCLQDSFFPATCLAHYLGIWHRVQQAMHPITKEGMIIYDEHTNGLHIKPPLALWPEVLALAGRRVEKTGRATGLARMSLPLVPVRYSMFLPLLLHAHAWSSGLLLSLAADSTRNHYPQFLDSPCQLPHQAPGAGRTGWPGRGVGRWSGLPGRCGRSPLLPQRAALEGALAG